MMTPERAHPTVAAVLTPAGTGAIAVIRVAGPDALEILRRRFAPVSGPLPAHPPPDRLYYGRWLDAPDDSGLSATGGSACGGSTQDSALAIDDVIVSTDVAADGHAWVDISTHGGLRISERVLQSLQQEGALIVSWPESPWTTSPPAAAFDPEALTALVQAHTERAVRFIAHQRRHLPAHLEHIAGTARHDPPAARRLLAELLARSDAHRHLIDGATIVLTGPVNAGKSTLANRLLGAERSIVSEIPGTTRDWVAEPTAIHGIPVTIVDTAGLREGAGELEAEAIRRARAQASAADLRLLVLDVSDSAAWPGVYPPRRAAGSETDPDDARTIVVLNKTDLMFAWSASEIAAAGTPVLVSAATGAGLDQLTRLIAERLGPGVTEALVLSLFTSRQRAAAARLVVGTSVPGAVLADRITAELLACATAAPNAPISPSGTPPADSVPIIRTSC